MRRYAGRWGLLAVVCAVFLSGCTRRLDTQHDQALQRVRSLGGTIEPDPPTLMNPVRSINLARSDVTDEDMALLAKIPGVRVLNLDNTRITDKGLSHLNEMRVLSQLSVRDTQVTTEGVRALREANPRVMVRR